jgi:uncharacterized RDD family membrane protein YckC
MEDELLGRSMVVDLREGFMKVSLSPNAPFILLYLPEAHHIGSLWRRTFAFVVDGLILYTVGHIVGSACFDTLSRLGHWAHLLGFCLALAYFSTLESSIGGGQTIGKRLLRLRVVDTQGSLINWGKAAVRYTICAAPYFLNGVRYPEEVTTWVVISLIIFIELGVGGASLYLLTFNNRTRQALHDVAVGTYVADSSLPGPFKTEPIWGLHWAVISGFMTLIAFAALSKGINIDWRQKSGYVSQTLSDERLIEKLGGVRAAKVILWTPVQSDRSAYGNFISKKIPSKITVQWTGETVAREAFANQVAGIILKSDPRAEKQDVIRVEVGRSYSLGFASGNDYQSFSHTPAEWRQLVSGTPTDARPVAQPAR